MPFDSPYPARTARVRDARFEGYCEGCNCIAPYSRLNDDMMCEACGEPDHDDESDLDLSPAAMLREHGTWSL